MEHRALFPLYLLLILVACGTDEKNELVLQDGEFKVVLFLNPECPLCQSYSSTIKELQSEFSTDLKWIAVFPGKWTTKDSVDTFLSRYSLNFEHVIMDGDLKLANFYKATITPSVFVLNSEAAICYEGRIDDWAVETGVKKLKPSDHDLKNAIQALLNGEEVKVKKTVPVGCIIE